jgi:hypothetical protein
MYVARTTLYSEISSMSSITSYVHYVLLSVALLALACGQINPFHLVNGLYLLNTS